MKEKIGEYYLDEQQEKIVLDDNDYLLVVAGAGSGKTLTILGKINYLVKYKNVLPEEILCISFTRASSVSLKRKIKNELNMSINVYTFHKLALNVLDKCSYSFTIAQTDLLEIIIDDFFDNYILNYEYHMKLLLRYFKVIIIAGNIKDKYLKYKERHLKEFKTLKKLIVSFIHLFKCNNFGITDFEGFLQQSRDKFLNFNYFNQKILLTLILNIYIIYEKYLKDNCEIDFDDMIYAARDCIKNKDIDLNIKYIIIDEYQDTSLVRFLLIKEIINKTKAKLMVVGDDFQSIYKFTGCELSLFLNFKSYFSTAKIMKIENTYRNSKQLITMAGNFVMKNPLQIRKKLNSSKDNDKPIKISYYNNIKKTFLRLILKIYDDTKMSVLVLGRNNNDIYDVLDDNWVIKDNRLIYKHNKNINVYFLTVHKSKGLEEENVVIINLKNDILGFPSKMKNYKILRFVSINNEKFLFAEERRLFYVALTRTKNNVYLLVPNKQPSIFIKEIIRDYYRYIEILNI